MYGIEDKEQQAITRNLYLRHKADGAYCGSVHDSSWNRAKKEHECCHSRKAIYHRAGCPVRNGDMSDIKIGRPPRKEEEEIPLDFKTVVRNLRAEGLTSGEVLEQLLSDGIETTLRKVNSAYA